MKNKLLKIKDEIASKLQDIQDSASLTELQNQYLSRKGELAQIIKNIKDLEDDARVEVGKIANEVKQELTTKFSEVQAKLFGAKNEGFVDISLPGEDINTGSIHPISQIKEELENIFQSMGFSLLDGPELESDYYNFEALNIPADHPARDMQDTFYIGNDTVLRTHTSSIQVRAMKKYGAPFRGVGAGKVFRCEATDVRHEHTFYQFEGLMIDENINFANLKGILEEVGKKLFGPKTELRVRPKFYPFVEPGINGEYSCFLCQGKGCRLCKNTGWLEIIGAGMIHPNVLRAGGIDPEKYSGLAFGFGLNRLAMLKYNIGDTRVFNSGDLKFLKQF